MLKQFRVLAFCLCISACMTSDKLANAVDDPIVPVLDLLLERRGEDLRGHQVYRVTIRNSNPVPACTTNPEVFLSFRRVRDKALILGYDLLGEELLVFASHESARVDRLGDPVLPAGFQASFDLTIVPNHPSPDGSMSLLKNPNEPGRPLKPGEKLELTLYLWAQECLSSQAANDGAERHGAYVTSNSVRYPN